MTSAPPAPDADISDPNARDDQVDEELSRYADPDRPRSFFLYAGAGSGKTRSLVNVLAHIRAVHRKRLILGGRRVAVITYTNAACDEITHRMASDALIKVSTIHSFAWDLIGAYHSDIREWLRGHLREEIAELKEKQRKGRAGSKVAREREHQIAVKGSKLENIDSIRRFEYNPNGETHGRGALTHSEVIGAASWLLENKATLQRMLVSGFPIFLVDESQDTIAAFMKALLVVQGEHGKRFCLGLFGDTMQRIYGHGMVDLEGVIPEDWARPVKKLNHRSPQRVIRLINRIRTEVDHQQQLGRNDKPEGTVRLFVLPSAVEDKLAAESKVAQRMAEITGDSGWSDDQRNYKTLILEHHMAARRFGFAGLFGALSRVEKYRTGLLSGKLPELGLFGVRVLPFVRAERDGLRFEVARLIRQYSPLIRPEEFSAADGSQLECLRHARRAVDALMSLWKDGEQPRFLDVLSVVARERLFEVPEILEAALTGAEVDGDGVSAEAGDEDATDDEEFEAWNQVMELPFKEIGAYQEYVSDESSFGTHQGVKGLEFSRVLVLANDDEARGFTFNYESLLGAGAKNRQVQKSGKETSLERTRRLFYVTCSRAKESLAVVAYSRSPQSVRNFAVGQGLFEADEVEVWDDEGGATA